MDVTVRSQSRVQIYQSCWKRTGQRRCQGKVSVYLKQSSKTSDKLRTNLSDDYTTGDNKYPVTRQGTLNYLEKHSKSVI